MAIINPANKQRERQLIIAIQSRIAAMFDRKLAIYFATSNNAAINAYLKGGEDEAMQVLDKKSKELKKTLANLYKTTSDTFADRVINTSKCIHGKIWFKQNEDLLSNTVREATRLFIDEHVGEKTSLINDTSKWLLKKAIEKGVDEGLNPNEIADSVKESNPYLSQQRAHVISRTETHGAANYANNAAAKELEVEMMKEWVSAGDDRTRNTVNYNHIKANGQVVEMDAPFIVSGEQLDFPGDPKGSPGNIIMCRCASVFIVR